MTATRNDNYWIAIVLSVLFITAHAQTEVQVDPNTGKALIGLPIWKVNAGALSVPVTVSYNGGGIRPDDGEGSAGMGWSLNAGGAIVRELNDLPDDYNVANDTRKGWLFNTNRLTISAFNPSDNGCGSWSSFSTLTGLNDTEPDIFSFNAPGLSGKFLFDNSGTLRLMPYQDLQITYTSDAKGIVSFKITNNQGVAYSFSKRELTDRQSTKVMTGAVTHFSRDYSLYEQKCTFASAWYLTSIKGAYGERINLGYEYPTPTRSKQSVSIYSGTTPMVLYTIENLTYRPMLSGIQGLDYSVSFKYEGNEGPVSKLDVRAIEDNYASHSFNFSYGIYGSTDYGGQRHFLSSITEESNCKSFPAYRFSYHHANEVAFGSTIPRDLFGYFIGGGGEESETPMPGVYQNNAATDGERFRFYSKSGYTTISTGASRYVNAEVSYYGSLKRIVYPTSGYSEIAYQPNEFYDEGTGNTAYGAGVRVSSVTISDGDADATNDIIRTYEYKREDGKSSGRWLYTPVFAFADGTGVAISPTNLAPDQSILYERAVVLIPGNGKTVYEYNIPGHYPQLTTSDWTATRSRIVSQASGACPPQGNLVAGSYTYPFTPNTNYDFEQGLVSDIFHYAQSGKLVREQHYTYTRLNPGTVTVKGLRSQAARIASTYVFGLYAHVVNTSKVIQTESDVYHDPGSTTLTQTTSTNYVYNANQMLSETNSTGSDEQLLKTKFTYAKDLYSATPAGQSALMIKMLCDSLRHGTLIESRSQAGNSVVGAALTSFNNFGSGYVYPYQQLSYKGDGTLQGISLSGSEVVYDYNKYYITQTYESFNTLGRPQASIGIDRSIGSVFYGRDKATPLASIRNARISEVVFSDFENTESYQISGANATKVWTGVGSHQLDVGIPISKVNVTKSPAALRYRFRCRTYSNAGNDITLTLQPGNVTMTYPGAQSGKWMLLEKIVDVSAVSSPFTFQLTTNGSVTLDDLAFYPEHASLQSTTLLPFAGKTSETDNRGNTTFYEYDVLGRLAYVKDTDRNIIRAHDYLYQTDPYMGPIASFAPNGGNYPTGTGFTFANVNNCDNTLTYKWSVNGVELGNASLFSYTFNELGDFEVALVITNSKGESAASFQQFHIVPPPPQPLYLTPIGNSGELTCDNRVQSFSVAIAGGCYDPSTITCTWYFSKDNGPETILYFGQAITSLDNFDLFSGGSVNSNVMVRCVIKSACADTWGIINEAEAVFQFNRTDSSLPCVN